MHCNTIAKEGNMEYSICIRTLGHGGEKYKKLIESIKKLSIQPKEVIIAIPKGYEVQEENTIEAKIIYSEKGMLLQRIIGYEKAESKYVLLLDDDVEFEEALVEKLSKPILQGKGKLSFPIYKDLLPEKGVKGAIGALTLSAIPSFNKEEKYVKILPSGGYMYNRNYEPTRKWLESESGPGMCIFAERQALLNINLREELWVETPGYALREDALLIYKAFLKGYNTTAVDGISIGHLDVGSREENRNVKAAYSTTLNHLIFWYRFIYKERKTFGKKLLASVALGYWIISMSGYFIIKLLFKRDISSFKASFKGIYSGLKVMVQ